MSNKRLEMLLLNKGGVIGTIVPNCSRCGLTNGHKVIEIEYERCIRSEQKQRQDGQSG